MTQKFGIEQEFRCHSFGLDENGILVFADNAKVRRVQIGGKEFGIEKIIRGRKFAFDLEAPNGRNLEVSADEFEINEDKAGFYAVITSRMAKDAYRIIVEQERKK